MLPIPPIAPVAIRAGYVARRSARLDIARKMADYYFWQTQEANNETVLDGVINAFARGGVRTGASRGR
jgi:hypothetical protein